jgi:hypothetical protein
MPATKRAPQRVPTATEPIPVKASVETWKNDTAGTVVINRVGEYGRRMVDLIHGGRQFQITPEERRMNQNAAHSADLDNFSNGTLRPIDLLDDDPDTEKLRNNPNILGEKDLPMLFETKGEVFRQRLAAIENPAVLDRLADLARDPRFDASLAQYEMIKSRIVEMRTDAPAEETDTKPGRRPASEPVLGRAVTPR